MPDHGVAHLAGFLPYQGGVSRILEQEIGQITTVECLAHRFGSSSQGEKGWIKIEPVYHHLRLTARLNAGTGDDQGNPNPPFLQVNLALVERGVVGKDMLLHAFHSTVV